MMIKKYKLLSELSDFIENSCFVFLKLMKLSLSTARRNQLLISCFLPPNIAILQRLLAPLQLSYKCRTIEFNTIVQVSFLYHQLCLMQV